MTCQADILRDLARARVAFQRRAILAAMGIDPDSPEPCRVCGDEHIGEPPLPCRTGDGV